ncbi:O-methyltransferase [Patescibacteria group bacterium]
MDHETGQFLYNLIVKNDYKKILEIGTSIGYSGLWFAKALRETGGKLYTVESNNERYEIARENFSEAEVLDIVKQLKGHAPDVPIPDMVDFLFLDATKFEYKYYLSTYLFHMKKGGMIVADNAISHAEDMKVYIDMVNNSDQLETKLVELGTGLLVSKIK